MYGGILTVPLLWDTLGIIEHMCRLRMKGHHVRRESGHNHFDNNRHVLKYINNTFTHHQNII